MEKITKKVYIPIIIALIACCGVLGWLAFNNASQVATSDYENNVSQISEMSAEEQQAQLDQLVKDNEMNVQYVPSCTFKGKVSEDFNLKNIANNKHPMVFEIYDENGESIYQSKKIELGYEINGLELDKALSSGTHTGKIRIGYDVEGNVSSTFPLTMEVE